MSRRSEAREGLINSIAWTLAQGIYRDQQEFSVAAAELLDGGWQAAIMARYRYDY